MSPMYEYQCQKCDAIYCFIKPYHMRDISHTCEGCDTEEDMKLMVSKPGFRRDHTVVEEVN